MNQGGLAIVLHAHLPYVHHPEYESFFEENWLFEAISDCYLPLLAMLDRLQVEAIDYRLTLSLSPTLMTMLQDALLQERFLKYLRQRQQLLEKELIRTRKQPHLYALATEYQQRYMQMLRQYQDNYQCDLLAAFKRHQQTGKLTLMTTAATHGFLPLLNVTESAVYQQIKVGLETFESFFGFQPDGFWLPECGYYQGLETVLKDCGVQYFFVDSHAIINASQQPADGVYAPLDCGNGVMAFGRDPAASRQVWSAQEGYPGDAAYREYYRDIGFDLPLEYIGPFLPDGNIRTHTGIKYHRITGKDPGKQEYYHADKARLKANEHAAHFVAERQKQYQVLQENCIHPAIIVAPYDAELLGHWWYEGPLWLEQVLRLTASQQCSLKLVSCDDYLHEYTRHSVAQPQASSWGDQGYNSFWLNESNQWVYPLLHQAAEEFDKLVADLKDKELSDLQQRAMNQALRSLLLAQASDWTFILKTGTTTEYAKKQLQDHLARFNYLHESIRCNQIDERYLAALEIMDDIFPQLDWRFGGP